MPAQSRMAEEIPSVRDLCRKPEVTVEEIEAATAAYLKDATAKPFAFNLGDTIDVAKDIEMHPQAREAAGRRSDRTRPSPHDGEDRRHHGPSGTEMSDAPDQKRKAIADSVLARLSTFALGVGLYEGIARSIVEKAVADIPEASIEQIATAARMMMLFVSG